VSNKSHWIHCAECGRNRLHKAYGLCNRCYYRQWREEHPGYHYHYQWREEHPGCQRQWRENNSERRAECNRRWRKAHKKHIAEYNRQYKMANPQQAANRRRRARKRNVMVEYIDEQLIYNRDGHACVYCKDARDLTLDHVVALARGGAHSYDNLVVACRSCNSSKGVKDVGEWLGEKNLLPFPIATHTREATSWEPI